MVLKFFYRESQLVPDRRGQCKSAVLNYGRLIGVVLLETRHCPASLRHLNKSLVRVIVRRSDRISRENGPFT